MVCVVDAAVIRGDTFQIIIIFLSLVVVVVVIVVVVVVVVVLHDVIVWVVVVSFDRSFLWTSTDARPDHVVNSN